MPEMGMKSEPASANMMDALFTTTQQRVLGLLFGQPERSFFATDIIRRTGSGSGAVQRELARLAESALVVVTRVGNQKHYQANREAALFPELHTIMIKTSGMAAPLRAALAPLAERIELALVYGSIARREDRADSDVDLLLVATDVTLEEVFACLATAEGMLGRKINPTLYTPEEFQRRVQRGSSFLQTVLAREHLLLMGTEDALLAAR